jgi:hypothetical protein
MKKDLRKRIALTIPIVAVVPLLLHASLPVTDWASGLGVLMVCVMCVLGLQSIWTRPAGEPGNETAPDDGDAPATRWTGIREDRRGLFRRDRRA